MVSTKQDVKLALGRIASIGQLYDIRNDTFLPNVNIFNSSILDSTDIIEIDEANTDVLFGERIVDDTELQLSVLSELACMKNLQNTFCLLDSNRYNTALVYSLQTYHETIYMQANRNKIDVQALTNSKATHVVVGIHWGVQVRITCEYEKSQSDPLDDDIQMEARNQLNLVKDLINDGRLQGKNKAEVLEKMKNSSFSFKCISDFDEVNGEMSIKDILQHIEQMSSNPITDSEGKGIPLKYVLFPVRLITKMLRANVDGVITQTFPVQQELIKKILGLFSRINHIKFLLIDFETEVSRSNEFTSSSNKKKLKDYLRQVKDQEKTFKFDLATRLVNVRSGIMPHDALVHLHMKYDEFSSKDIQDWIEATRSSILKKRTFIDSLGKLGITYSKSEASQILLCNSKMQTSTNLTQSQQNDSNHCRSYRDLIEQNQVSSEMLSINNRTNSPIVTFMLHVDDDLLDSKRWKENEELFLRLYHGYCDSKEHYFCVKDIEGGGIRIEKYINNTLESDDYWDEKGNTISIAQLLMKDKLRVTRTKGNREKPVILQCSKCEGDQMEWFCFTCNEKVYYDDKKIALNCDCGAYHLSSVHFRCPSNKHGFEFSQCNHDQLQKYLNEMETYLETNILILGETGVGKSTWINALANYAKYDTLEEAKREGPITLIPSKFVFEDKEILIGDQDDSQECNEIGKSSTQYPVSHSFYLGSNKVINLIDTPGIGDARGIGQDKINFENILAHLTNYNKIHAICILLTTNHSTLTVSFRYCISQLFIHLHSSLAKNIIFCFTHARGTFYSGGDTLPILRKYLEEQSLPVKCTKENQFFFDSESFRFLAILKNGIVNIKSEDCDIYALSWNRAVSENLRLINYIDSLPAHDASDTISLNEARRRIIQMGKPLTKLSQSIQTNVMNATKKKEEIQKSKEQEQEIEEQLKFYGTTIEVVPLNYPRTVCTHGNCVRIVKEKLRHGKEIVKTEYVKWCHERCYLRDIPIGTKGQLALKGCHAFRKGRKCANCKHTFNDHMHIDYEFKHKPKDFLKDELRTTKNDQENVLLFLESLDRLLNELRREEKQITTTCAEFACYLRDKSITPFNDSTEDHISYLIEESRKEGKSREEINKLRDLLDDYIKEKKIIEGYMKYQPSKTRINKPEDVDELFRQLFKLKHYGTEIKEISLKIDFIRKKNAKFIRKPVDASNKKSKRLLNLKSLAKSYAK